MANNPGWYIFECGFSINKVFVVSYEEDPDLWSRPYGVFTLSAAGGANYFGPFGSQQQAYEIAVSKASQFGAKVEIM